MNATDPIKGGIIPLLDPSEPMGMHVMDHARAGAEIPARRPFVGMACKDRELVDGARRY